VTLIASAVVAVIDIGVPTHAETNELRLTVARITERLNGRDMVTPRPERMGQSVAWVK